MTAENTVLIPNRGKIDSGIPAQQQCQVILETLA